MHTFLLDKIKYSFNEHYEIVNKDEWKLLNPNFYEITNEEDPEISNFNYNDIMKYGDIYKNNNKTLIGVIKTLLSLKKVTNLWISKDIKYDFYIYLRYDLLYHDKINIDEIYKNIDNNVLFSPKWQTYGCINDRFAYGNKKVMQIYGNRIDFIINYLKNTNKCFHPEYFLNYVMQKNNIKNFYINLRGSRMRNKNIINENFICNIKKNKIYKKMFDKKLAEVRKKCIISKKK